VNWGTLFPLTTLVAVIVLAYSIISPIINGLACAAFYLFYLAYKYLFTYKLDQPKSGETGGRFFPKAIQHLFVGLYIQQLCLAALFFLARDLTNKASAIPEGALMIVLLGLTAFFHIIINDRYGPLIRYVPITFQEGEPDHLMNTKGPLPSEGGVIRHKRDEPEEQITQGEASQIHSTENGTENGVENGVENGIAAETKVKDMDEVDLPVQFVHPAMNERQPVIWIPRDEFGLYKGELEEMLSEKKVEFDEEEEKTVDTEHFEEPEDAVKSIRASTRDAVIDSKGHVELLRDRGPPEEREILGKREEIVYE